MSRSEQEIIDEVVILIRTGFPVTKVHLANLCGANDEVLKYLKSNITSDDLSNLANIAVVKAKFSENPHITEQMLILVINYLKVRQFLRSINVPYFDVDENQLVNGNALLESKSIEKINSNASQSGTNNEKLSSFAHVNSKDVGSQSFSGLVSSSQRSQYSQVADLLEEDEDDFAAIVASYDSKTENTASKPLQDSQKSNQNNNIKQFELKPATKLSSVATKNVSKTVTVSKKRTIAASKYAVQYYSDSDSDPAEPADNAEPQAKRALPQWMSTKKSTNTATHANVQSIPIRKKSFF